MLAVPVAVRLVRVAVLPVKELTVATPRLVRPVTAKLVEVVLVPVALVQRRPVAERLEAFKAETPKLVAYRFVLVTEVKAELVEKRFEPVALVKLRVVRVEEPELAKKPVRDTDDPVALVNDRPFKAVVPVAFRFPKLPVTKLPVRILAELETARVPTVAVLTVSA